MSVRVYQYVIYGYKLSKEWIKEWENINEKVFYDYLSEWHVRNKNQNELALIYDGYSGQDNYFGKVLKRTDNYEHLESFAFYDLSLDGVTEIGLNMKMREILHLNLEKNHSLRQKFNGPTYYVVTNLV